MIDAGYICNVGRVFKIQVDPIPARLKIDLSSHAIDAIGSKQIVFFWYIVSFVNAAETYPASC